MHRICWDPVPAEKGGYKPLHGQGDPRAAAGDRRDARRQGVARDRRDLVRLALDAGARREVRRVLLLACGTSWHAALVGKFLIEGMARIPVEVDYGCEYRYRDPIVNDRTLTIGDLAVRRDGRHGRGDLGGASGAARLIAAIVNVPGSRSPHGRGPSSHPRRARDRRRLHEGVHDPARGSLSRCRAAAPAHGLAPVLSPAGAGAGAPAAGALATHWSSSPRSRSSPDSYQHAKDFLYLGRGIHYPMALEGALKLKEISYIHAEGYPGRRDEARSDRADRREPAGGRARAPRRVAREELSQSAGGQVARRNRDRARYATGHEVDARRRPRLPFPRRCPSCSRSCPSFRCSCSPTTSPCGAGCDVDQPRNLAKSVTVE